MLWVELGEISDSDAMVTVPLVIPKGRIGRILPDIGKDGPNGVGQFSWPEDENVLGRSFPAYFPLRLGT